MTDAGEFGDLDRPEVRIVLVGGQRLAFDHVVGFEFDKTVLQITRHGKTWTFPMANIAYFITEESL